MDKLETLFFGFYGINPNYQSNNFQDNRGTYFAISSQFRAGLVKSDVFVSIKENTKGRFDPKLDLIVTLEEKIIKTPNNQQEIIERVGHDFKGTEIISSIPNGIYINIPSSLEIFQINNIIEYERSIGFHRDKINKNSKIIKTNIRD